MNGLIKQLSGEVHPFEIAFFRNLFGFVILLPLLLRAGFGSLGTQRLGLHALRGVLNAFAMLTFFFAVGITPLATVAALGFTAPLFAALFAALILKERVGPRRVAAIIVGFTGALVILRPGIGEVGIGQILLVLSSTVWAVALIVIKTLSRTDTSLTITVYAAIFLTPMTLAAAFPFWVWPDLGQLALLVSIGVFGSLYQLALAQALRLADATVVMPVDFTKLVWSALIGWVAFAETPDLWVLIGGAVIFGSVIYVTYREAQVKTVAREASARP
jgi:drug/metabolite transporter (DMT)-like permease